MSEVLGPTSIELSPLLVGELERTFTLRSAPGVNSPHSELYLKNALRDGEVTAVRIGGSTRSAASLSFSR
jgi:hypothetical protein